MTEMGVNMGKQRAIRRASGFTLIEVIVAISLLMVVVAAATPLIVNGLKLSAAQQRQQVGVIVANEAMENVRARTKSLSNVEDLVTGRSAAAVAAQFSALSDVAGVSQTNPASDPKASTATDLPLPISGTDSRDGTVYEVNTVIGTCTQSVTSSGTGACTKAATSPSGRSMVRVIVVVSWSNSGGCTADGCRYVTSTLLNLDRDLEWSDVVS